MTAARTWRLVETHDVTAAYAMGLDEALLRSVGAPPTLRLYSWEPDALSLGYFQRFEDVPAALAHPQVVRRLTGGGAIHHHRGELTFAITLDADDGAYRGSVPHSYERAHRAIIRALGELGADARMRRDEPCASDAAGTGMCFHESTPQDVSWEAGPARPGLRKGVGTAQRRSGGRILHHGSIKLGPSPLEPGIATLAETPGATSERARAAEALARAMAAEFAVELEPVRARDLGLDPEARDLGARYGDPSFVRRQVRRRRG